MLGKFNYFGYSLIAGLLLLMSACGGGVPPSTSSAAVLKDPPTDCSNPLVQPFPKDIRSPYQIGPDCYAIDDEVIIYEGGSLTIAPNTVLRFGSKASLTVFGGFLQAVGTTKAPILFTGNHDFPGYWKGVRFLYHANYNNSRLQNAIIRYAGQEWDDPAQVSAALVLHARTKNVENLGSTSVSATRIEHSGGYGAYLGDGAIISNFSNNSITDSQDEPLYVHVSQVHRIETNNELRNNGTNRIRVFGDKLGDSDPNNQSEYFNWPYHANNDYYIEDFVSVYAPLVLNEGTTLYFAKDAGLAIYGSGQQNYLSAKGSSSKPIRFTSDTMTPGSWKGIIYYSTASALNILDHVIIEFAGSKHKALDYGTAIYLNSLLNDSNTNLTLTNSTISDTQGYGFYLENNTEFFDFSNNIIRNNTIGAAAVKLTQLPMLDVDSNYTGNANNHILITSNEVKNDDVIEMPGINATYRLPYGLIIRGRMIIDEGATIEVASEKSILIDGTVGTLKINGTNQNPVNIRSYINELANAISSNWVGLIFQNSSKQNSIDYANLDFAGSYNGSKIRTPQGATEGAAIFLTSTIQGANSSVTISNTDISYIEGNYAVWSDPDSQADIQIGNSFEKQNCLDCPIQ